MTELKNCPFCGHEPAVDETEPNRWLICCNNDRCRMDVFTDGMTSREAAITAWNARTSGWISVEERLPESGEQLWVVVVEWDRIHRHVDYAVTFDDIEGLMVHRKEDDYDEYGVKWPPKDITHWMVADVPPLPDSFLATSDLAEQAR